MATRKPLVIVSGTVQEISASDTLYPLTATMLAFLSHCSVSGDGMPLWDGQPWCEAEPGGGGIGSMVVGSTFVVG
jgi:hypothetical protein